MGLIVLASGLGLDLILGDPQGWPHPVRGLGWVIDRGRGFILARGWTARGQKGAGLTLALLLVGCCWLAAALVLAGLEALWPPLAWLAGAWMIWSSLSLKDLLVHVRSVLESLLSGRIYLARKRLGLVVGRRTAELDQTGLTRASLETLAENLSDGVVAPLFFIILGGPAAGLAYKAVNTLDSMVGYLHPPFTHLGFWPAKLDDLVNWLPARLTFLLIVAGAALQGLDPKGAFKVSLAEHNKSSSPNAGWPEAALAGGLGVSLLGPAVYGGELVDKPFINAQARPPESSDLQAGLSLVRTSGLLAYGLGLAAAAAVSI
ncbi:MAG: cobalamin biosynthesis protein CobD [Deltaproteobacteria bacterium]|nr:cobalamin biosynthesis protein CobD [Deltaproteobacteria bacterium]